jgi:hypothetical protein
MMAVVTVAGLCGVEQVAEDEDHGEDEEWERLHVVDLLKKIKKNEKKFAKER